jgi:hypothetical protein
VRKRSVRLIVENAESVRLNDLCKRIWPAQVFLRTTADLATSSRCAPYDLGITRVRTQKNVTLWLR